MRKNLLSKVFGVVAALTMATSATVGTASAADGTWSNNGSQWLYYPIYNYQVNYPTLIRNNGYFGWNYRNVDIAGERHCKVIQSMLNKNTNIWLTVDGILGQQSDKAIKNFQTKKGLYSDGIVGRDTYKALANSSNTYKAKNYGICVPK